ncbi:MAG: hypothetical protein AAFU79_04330, partial [Myxococcota bacterium]
MGVASRNRASASSAVELRPEDAAGGLVFEASGSAGVIVGLSPDLAGLRSGVRAGRPSASPGPAFGGAPSPGLTSRGLEAREGGRPSAPPRRGFEGAPSPGLAALGEEARTGRRPSAASRPAFEDAPSPGVVSLGPRARTGDGLSPPPRGPASDFASPRRAEE